MSRARLTQTPVDLISDGGAILLSLVKGEQIEFPVQLDFLSDTTIKPSGNYIYEAVVVESKNTPTQTTAPVEVMPDGIHTTLTVRLPSFIGTWSTATAYNREEVVEYDSKYYRLLAGTARVSSTLPSLDSLWEETTLNTIYIQFASNLITSWSVQPSVAHPVYGFFELRVTEPANVIFTKTWKPVRGMIEVLFSPTDEVDDV